MVIAIIAVLIGPCCPRCRTRGRRRGEWTARAICTRSAWGCIQYFDDWDGQFFLHHPFDADSLSEVGDAESFAEIYWEDKIMPYVNPAYANDAIAKGGVQVDDEKIFRCMSDTSVVSAVRRPDHRARSTGSRTGRAT